MNLNQAQAFTFGPYPFLQEQPNTKHPQISKVSPFYKITKPKTEHKNREKKEQPNPKLMQTLGKTEEDKENAPKNQDYQSLNTTHHRRFASKHTRNPTDLQLVRLETSPNISQKSDLQAAPINKIFRKLSYNSKSQLKTIDIQVNPVVDKYKLIANQLKQMFIKQQQLHQRNAPQEQIDQLYKQFDCLCQQF